MNALPIGIVTMTSPTLTPLRGPLTAAIWILAISAAMPMAACTSTPRGHHAKLYDRLGQQAGIDRVTSRVIDRIAQDPRTKRSFKDVKLSTLKNSIAQYLCNISDGPCTYEGANMADAHSQTNNTATEFDVMVQVLREELDADGVPQGAKNELLKRLAPTYRDVVQAP